MVLEPVFVLSAMFVLLGASLLRGWAHAFFAVPSTLLHEFCHYLVAYVTGSQPAPMDIVPKRSGSEWVLGSVSFYPGPLTAAWVALAPLLLLPLAWALVPTDPLSTWGSSMWHGAFFAWCLMGAWPSRADWVIAFSRPFGLVLLGLLASVFLHIG